MLLHGQLLASGATRPGRINDIRIAFHEAQYHVQPSGRHPGYRLNNPENHLQADFHDGIVSAQHPAGRFGLRLEAYGHSGQMLRPAPPTIHASAKRVEFRRGPLTEWYVNDVRGIEQGFTLRQRPAHPQGESLIIELSVTGDLTPALVDDHIALQRDGRTVLVYTGLQAWDAQGRQLPGRMEVLGARLRLLVDDAAAEYPVTIDPWIQQQTLTLADGTAFDNFGVAVAVQGDTAVVGAVGRGAVYVYSRSGNTWTQQQTLLPSDPAEGASCGYTAAISGDTIVIGCPDKNAYRGAAYIFVRSGTTWTQQQIVTPSDVTPNDHFGYSVSVSGDTTLVGAPGRKPGGYAYVFKRSGTSWSEQQRLTAWGYINPQGDQFGFSVSLDGDTALVGAELADPTGINPPASFEVPAVAPKFTNKGIEGAAYVFVRTGTSWSQLQRLRGSPAAVEVDNYFGCSVSLQGDTALVGADNVDDEWRGAAYVFVRSGSTWALQQQLTASDRAVQSDFGLGVAVSGNTAVVGARRANSGEGAAYVFLRSGSSWVEAQKLLASDHVRGAAFGIPSIGSDTLMIGAPGRYIYTGAVYTFNLTAPPVVTSVDSTSPDGTYGIGAVINITAAFSGIVNVTGTPRIALNNGAFANYTSGSGTSILNFTYTVGPGQTTPHLDYSSTFALTGGTIVAQDGLTTALLTLPATGTPGSLGANSNIAITNTQTYTISGTVTLSGTAVAGVTVALSGSQSGSTTTSAAGTYVFTGLAPGGTFTITPTRSGFGFTPASYAIPNLNSNQTRDFTATLFGTSLVFYPVTPCRLVDTRVPSMQSGFGPPAMAAGGTRTFAIPSNTACGIPSTAAAYSLNVTVVTKGYLGILTIWPAGQPMPNASTLNSYLPTSTAMSNAAIVPAGTSGAVNVWVTDATELILDINGYFAPPDTSNLAFFPVTPCRLVDTRRSDFPSGFGTPTMDAGTTRTFPIPANTRCGIPSTAAAYSLNVTAVPVNTLGYLTLWPAGGPKPNVSTLNVYTPHDVDSNAAIVPSGPNGAISAYVMDATDMIIDINGYFAPSTGSGLRFYTAPPCRVADTRVSGPPGMGPPSMAKETQRSFNVPGVCGIPAGAGAYSFNFTAVPKAPLLGIFITWPTGVPMPDVSTMNSYSGLVVSNAAIVPAGANGAISIYVTDEAEVLFDVNGFFAP